MAAILAASTARASAAGLRTPDILLATRQRVGGLAAITHRPLGTPTYQPLQLHSFSASAVASANDIAAIVGDELKYEKESYAQPSITPPSGWNVTEKDGRSKVSLTRDYKDEVLQVDFTAREYEGDEPYEEEEEEEDDEDADVGEDEGVPLPDTMTLDVCIMKEGSKEALMFEVETDGESMDIMDVSLQSPNAEDMDEEDNEDTLYGGPVFSELDPKLQQAFMDYLEERGVNADLGRFVMDFAEDKEQRDYMNWLQGVKEFLKK